MRRREFLATFTAPLVLRSTFVPRPASPAPGSREPLPQAPIVPPPGLYSHIHRQNLPSTGPVARGAHPRPDRIGEYTTVLEEKQREFQLQV